MPLQAYAHRWAHVVHTHTYTHTDICERKRTHAYFWHVWMAMARQGDDAASGVRTGGRTWCTHTHAHTHTHRRMHTHTHLRTHTYTRLFLARVDGDGPPGRCCCFRRTHTGTHTRAYLWHVVDGDGHRQGDGAASGVRAHAYAHICAQAYLGHVVDGDGHRQGDARARLGQDGQEGGHALREIMDRDCQAREHTCAHSRGSSSSSSSSRSVTSSHVLPTLLVFRATSACSAHMSM